MLETKIKNIILESENLKDLIIRFTSTQFSYLLENKNLLDYVSYKFEKEIFMEGINIDTINKQIEYTNEHQNNLDTSLENNPQIYKLDSLDGIKITSIYRRTNNKIHDDANPITYALKGNYNWKFINEENKEAFLNQTKLILNKYLDTIDSNIILIIPSTSKINSFLAFVITNEIKKRNLNIDIYDNWFSKFTFDEVIHYIVNEKRPKELSGYTNEEFENLLDKLYDYKEKLKSKYNHDYYIAHEIKEQNIRDLIDKTMKINTDYINKQYNIISDNDILLVDDTIRKGNTLKEAKNLIDCYNPKSVSILTLFSPMIT